MARHPHGGNASMHWQPAYGDRKMDVQLTRMQIEIQKAALEFAKGEFDSPTAIELDREASFPRRAWKKAGQLGFIGLNLPEEYAGGGLGVFETVLVGEALCRRDASMGIALGMADAMVECLWMFGTEDQKQRYLPAICEGRMLCGISLDDIHPDHARGRTACQLIASHEHLEISGRKHQVVNGPMADLFLLACAENQTSSAGDSRTLVLLPKNAGGITVTPIANRLGVRMTSIGGCQFDRLRVPIDSRVGRRGGADAHFREILPIFFVKLAAMALGTAQGALDRSLDYVRQRTQFGRKIGAFQVSRHKLAQMSLNVEQARSLIYRCAGLMDAGQTDIGMAAAAKLCACDAAVHTAYEAIQLLGGYGYMTEYDVERFYRDAKMLQLTGGNTHRLKDIIADQVIGKIG